MMTRSLLAQTSVDLRGDVTATGERASWLAREFCSSYVWLKSKIQRSVGCHADAEDLASSSFVELAGVSDVAAVRDSRALLTVISKRLTYDLWRRRDLERAYVISLTSGGEPLAISAESAAEISQTLLLVDQALNGLPPNARRAFVYSQVDGLAYPEIAKKLGVSVSMVRKYLAQALSECYSLM
jgi:RNA polymerase sigma-19 factor, ECF subfamily